jgi:hypothetical protein
MFLVMTSQDDVMGKYLLRDHAHAHAPPTLLLIAPSLFASRNVV